VTASYNTSTMSPKMEEMVTSIGGEGFDMLFGSQSGELANFLLPPQSEQDQGKLTVVLDIDETLVHTEFLPEHIMLTPEKIEFFNANCNSQFFCVFVTGRAALVRKRPFLREFLQEASKRYELITFTAGSEEYANAVLDRLDPNGSIFRHRLFRQHCCANGLVKDLRILNRNLQRTVMVDNSHFSFLFQLGNGIPIESFYDDSADKALIMLHDFLDALRNEEDVRSSLRSIFKLETKLARFY